MVPLDQTDLGRDTGNCFPAAIASILELPLADVPNFKEEDWFNQFSEWLYDYGLLALYFHKSEIDFEHITNNAICEASVESPRFPGVMHSVVFHKGKVIHDPHPDKKSMSATLEDLKSLIVFAAIDPAKQKEAPDAEPDA